MTGSSGGDDDEDPQQQHARMTLPEVAANSPVRLGLVPTTHALHETALIGQLAVALGVRWRVQTFRSYAALVEALGRGDVEVAWLPPLAYARAVRAGAADLLLTVEREGQQSFNAAIVARDSPEAAEQGLAFVARKRAAWVDVWSAAGYLVPRQMLRAAGIDPERAFTSQLFLGSHSAVVEAVARGEAEVGATYCLTDERGAIVRAGWGEEHKLRALAVSESIPGDTLCIAPSVGVREGRAIAQRLVAFASAPSTAGVFAQVFGADRLVPGDPARYSALERALADELVDGEG